MLCNQHSNEVYTLCFRPICTTTEVNKNQNANPNKEDDDCQHNTTELMQSEGFLPNASIEECDEDGHDRRCPTAWRLMARMGAILSPPRRRRQWRQRICVSAPLSLPFCDVETRKVSVSNIL